MRPRTKARIEKEIKRNEGFLTEAIDNSLYQEERCAKDIKDQEGRLKKLRAEPCFEDTFEGKVEKFEKIAFAEIEVILEELSEVTGKDYLNKLSLEELFGVDEYTH